MPYVLVTGIALADQFIENVLVTPLAVLHSVKFERFEANFSGAGETLSAALAALLANGHDLPEATAEALGFLDQSLCAGFKPGMGLVVPDRMFWAQAESVEDLEVIAGSSELDAANTTIDETAVQADKSSLQSRILFSSSTKPFFDMPPNGTTKH